MFSISFSCYKRLLGLGLGGKNQKFPLITMVVMIIIKYSGFIVFSIRAARLDDENLFKMSFGFRAAIYHVL